MLDFNTKIKFTIKTNNDIGIILVLHINGCQRNAEQNHKRP